MTFQLNGESHETRGPLSVRSLLEEHDLQTRRVAVAINAEVVPRSQFDLRKIEDGDEVEVIQAVGGG